MSNNWWEVPNPMGSLLGGARKAPLPLEVAPPPPVIRRKVTIEDAFIRTKPKQKQKRARNGEVSPTTLRGRVLLVMCRLANGRTDVVIKDADIVYHAWKMFPEVFGLSGYDCPDASKSRAKICGPEGLIGRGMVVRVHEGVYRLTQKAVDWTKSV
jgi:hypothetical protein